MANERVTRDIIINYTESNAEVVKDTIKTIDRMIQNRQLNRYWKDQNVLINDVTSSYEKYNKTLNKMDATELVKSFNALKALSGIKELDISQLLPNFDKVEGKVKELIKSIDLNEAFGVDAFSSAFKVFDMLKVGGIDLQDFFKRFDLDIDTQNLQKSLRLAEKEIQRVKNELVEKDMKIDSLISGSGFSELQSQLERANDELSSLKSNATEVFKQFLRSNGFDDYFTSFKDDELFRPYIEEIEKGYITSTQAITQFKLANRDLLQDFNKNTENGFNTEQLNLFLSKLEEIFKQTQAISENINNIMTNGVMTKAMQNLSVDDTISQSQRDLFANVLKDEEALSSIAGVLKKIIDESVTLQGVNNKTFDEEQFNRLLILFENIESSLSSMKAVFVDVGDGEEFSPLLKMINNVQESIEKLSTSVKGIGLNMNIDVGSDKELETQFQDKVSKALIAYQRLFDHIKMSGVGGSVINDAFFNFDLNHFDTTIGKVKALQQFIDKTRDDAKALYGGQDVLKQDTDAKFWNQASAALAQIKIVEKRIKASTDTSPLENLFGKTDLTEVVTQLNLIVDKLGEISTTASEFKNVFANGFNVSASVEEIEKLTSRVKELEDELSKIKMPTSTSPVETNILSGNEAVETRQEMDVITKKLQEINSLENEISNKKLVGEDTRMLVLDLELAKQKLKDLTAVKLQEELKEILGTTNLWYRRVKSTSELLADTGGYFSDSLLSAASYFDVSDYRQQMLVSQIDTSKFFEIDAKGNQWNSLEKPFEESELNQRFKELGMTIDEFIEKYHIRVDLGAKYTTEFVANVAKELGYLGIIFKNINDNSIFNADGTILPATTTSIQVFDESSLGNVKNITNLLLGVSDIITDISKNDLVASQKNGGDLIAQITKVQQKLVELRKTTDGKGTSTKKLEDIKNLLLEIQSVNFHNLDKIEQDNLLNKLQQNLFKLKDSSATKKFSDIYNPIIKSIEKELVGIKSTPIKDTFQGDKIEQATTSAKELDKTLEQAVDMPTDNFDNILSKLDLTKSKLGEIIKITKQTHIDADGKPIESYTLKDKYGSTEIYGESSNPQLLRSNIVEYDAKQVEKKAQAEQKVAEAMAKGREQSEKARQSEQKRQELAQNKAINKALEQEYQERQKVAEASRKQAELDKQNALAFTKSASKRLSSAISEYSYGDTSDATAMMKQMNRGLSNFGDLSNIQGNIEKLSSSIDKIISDLQISHKQSLSALEQEIKEEEVLQAQKDAFHKKNLNAIDMEIKKREEESSAYANTLKSQMEERYNAISSMEKSLDNYNSKLEKFSVKPADGHRYPVYQQQIDNLTKKISELDTLKNNLSKKDIIDESDMKSVNALQQEIDELILKMNNMSAGEKGFDPLGADKALEKIYNELQKNSGMSKEAKRQIQGYYDEIRSGNPSKPIKDLLDDMYKLIQLEREAGRAHKSFNDIFKEKVVYGAAANLAGMIGIYDIINVGRQAVDIVIDLNTQITELAKVSEATSSQIYNDFNSYAEIAKDVGGTISDTISATADWSRNGYNIPDSKELAEVALIYKNVGDGIDIDQANEYLISTLRGFNLEAKDAMNIIDSMNEVANNEPISASGIGEALQRSAAAFNAANTSLQESIALVTSTNSVLQSPEKVGSMWTTVSARIRGAKTELEEAGLETDGMVESTSKLQAMIKGMTGFDILESDGETFKSIYDIIIGIGDEFQNLSDLDQAALLEALAGKRQSNALAATLNNIDLLKKSYQEATNAEGSAMEEQRKYQESVQYSIDRTKASLEELANDFMSSDFLKGLIDSGDKLINILDWIIDKFGVLGTLAGGVGIFAGIKNVGEGKMYPFIVLNSQQQYVFFRIRKFSYCQ